MTVSASVVRLGEDRQLRGQAAHGWSDSGSSPPVGMEESLAATLASVVSLMEEAARIQREIAEALRVLAAQNKNLAAIQALAQSHNDLVAWLSQRNRRNRPVKRWVKAVAEPLTPREKTVLRMLVGRLSLREIGRELYVSHNTVKSHTGAIYRKLGVTNRHDAIQRYRELVSARADSADGARAYAGTG